MSNRFGKTNAVEKARAAWGDALPDWVQTLAEVVNGTSLTKAAKKVGYSSAAISNVIAHKYPGRLDNIEAAVRATLQQKEIVCPAMGVMPLSNCLENQDHVKGGNRSSAHRARLFKACRGNCPHSRLGGNNA